MSTPSRILVFTGDGKGKTTAALGMALRAAGHRMKVCVIQFIKHDDSVGELAALAHLPSVKVMQVGFGFVPPRQSPEMELHVSAAQAGFDLAKMALQSGEYGMVILDEICNAVGRHLIAEAEVIDIIRGAAAGMIVVLTGRGATPGIIDLADTVTEMRCVKHGFKTGITAQKGVEL